MSLSFFTKIKKKCVGVAVLHLLTIVFLFVCLNCYVNKSTGKVVKAAGFIKQAQRLLFFKMVFFFFSQSF